MRLREFIGFQKDSNLTEKIKTIKRTFTLTGIIQIANMLNIEIHADPFVLCDNNFQALRNLANLQKKFLTASINFDVEETPYLSFPTFLLINTVQRSSISPHAPPIHAPVLLKSWSQYQRNCR